MTKEVAEKIVRGITDKIECNTVDIDDWAEFWGFTREEYEEFLDMAIKVLEQTRWIPVSEKPQEGRYLCTFEHYDGKCIDFGSFDGEKWYIKPIAYMPLPEPYKAESEDEE